MSGALKHPEDEHFFLPFEKYIILTHVLKNLSILYKIERSADFFGVYTLSEKKNGWIIHDCFM